LELPMTRTRPATGLGLADRIGIIGVLAIAVTLPALALTGMWFSLKQKLVDGIYVFTFQLAGNTREVSFPQVGDVRVEHANQSNEVVVTASGFSSTVVNLTIAQHVLAALLYLSIAVVAIELGRRLWRGRPFFRSVTIALQVLAIVLIVAGTGLEVLGNLTTSLAQEELTGGSPDTPLGMTWGWTFIGGWFFAGIALALVAGAFQMGERLQRDTEGLV
jgi:hypothetical protein